MSTGASFSAVECKKTLRETLNWLGDECAMVLEPQLHEAAALFPEVLVLTHVPPFPEAAWHEGRPSGDDFLPFFSCKAVGDLLLGAAAAHPRVEFTVYCGHTHGGGVTQPAENLTVHTGAAEYGKPTHQVIELPEGISR